ncbi:MAG: gamma carbonic anhydrase family protein [Thermoplasmatota archaeon]
MTGTEYGPRIGDKTMVSKDSFITGDVKVGPNCSIWPFVVMRGDEDSITIEEGSNIQDGAIIHGDEGYPVHIGKEVTVGHGAIIHGCIIEDRCIIGIRSTILNGAKIGKGSIIGAGAVVTPGMEVPPHSMVLGIPGKVKKNDPNFEDQAFVNAKIYQELAQRYVRGEIERYQG